MALLWMTEGQGNDWSVSTTAGHGRESSRVRDRDGTRARPVRSSPEEPLSWGQSWEAGMAGQEGCVQVKDQGSRELKVEVRGGLKWRPQAPAWESKQVESEGTRSTQSLDGRKQELWPECWMQKSEKLSGEQCAALGVDRWSGGGGVTVIPGLVKPGILKSCGMTPSGEAGLRVFIIPNMIMNHAALGGPCKANTPHGRHKNFKKMPDNYC